MSFHLLANIVSSLSLLYCIYVLRRVRKENLLREAEEDEAVGRNRDA